MVEIFISLIVMRLTIFSRLCAVRISFEKYLLVSFYPFSCCIICVFLNYSCDFFVYLRFFVSPRYSSLIFVTDNFFYL